MSKRPVGALARPPLGDSLPCLQRLKATRLGRGAGRRIAGPGTHSFCLDGSIAVQRCGAAKQASKIGVGSDAGTE
jgi:hypothetical protein